MKAAKDLTGKRFGLLVVLSKTLGRQRPATYECRCDCGNLKRIRSYNLQSGNSKSCGCGQGRLTHGLTGLKTTKSWQAMIQRCYNPKNDKYHKYGAVGIRACEFIRVSPANIISLIGHRPNGKTIDRIKNSHGYHCGCCSECISNEWVLNVRWATPIEQNQNRISVRQITINGETKCIAEWARVTGLNENTFRSRVNRGTGIVPLLSKPNK